MMTRDGGHGYGLGWYLGQAYGQRLWSHGGFLDGFAAIKGQQSGPEAHDRDPRQHETTPAQTLARRLGALALGQPEVPDIVVPVGVLDRYVGFYRTGPRAVVALTPRARPARGPGTGLAPSSSLPESDRVFVAKDGKPDRPSTSNPTAAPRASLLDTASVTASDRASTRAPPGA